jgi:hypothetical protein
METIAVYFEAVAKSYGPHTVTGVVMVETPVAFESIARSDGPGSPPAAGSGKFSFVMLQRELDGTAVLYAVAPPEDIPSVLEAFGRPAAAAAADAGLRMQPVEMVLLQGPHFYERYGIAAAVLDKLRERKAVLLLAGFSGSMAYLVVPEGTAEIVRAALAECLHLP